MLRKIFRFLIWSLISILIIIFVILSYFYYQFNYYHPEDQAELNERNLAFFSENYLESRTRFRKNADILKIKYPNSIHSHFLIPSAIDQDLSVDYSFIPAQSDSSKIIIISSGVHGVEAYAGSAVQKMFTEEFIKDQLLENTGVLLIHSVNPYGFKYGRRVSENNVDLNRNSYYKDDLYETRNQGYPLVKDFINPQEKLNINSFFHRFFFVEAVKMILESGMPVLRQAVLQGQYRFPRGLYFGGHDQEPQIDSLMPIIQDYCKPYEEVLAFDLHTGYGARGMMHLFPNPVEEDLKNEMTDLFKGYTIDWGDSDDFYTVTGDFVNMIGQLNPEKKFIPMTLEFGTMDSQTTLGSVKSLQIMVAENQGAQYGYDTEEDQEEIQKMLLEMYQPSSSVWKSQVIDQSRAIFEEVLPRFAEK